MLQARAFADVYQKYRGKILIMASSIHRDYSMFDPIDNS